MGQKIQSQSSFIRTPKKEPLQHGQQRGAPGDATVASATDFEARVFQVSAQAEQLDETVRGFVRTRPLTATLVAVGVGLLAGVLFRKTRLADSRERNATGGSA